MFGKLLCWFSYSQLAEQSGRLWSCSHTEPSWAGCGWAALSRTHPCTARPAPCWH